MLAHIMGLPVEESLVQLAPAGAAAATVFVVAARVGLRRLIDRVRHG